MIVKMLTIHEWENVVFVLQNLIKSKILTIQQIYMTDIENKVTGAYFCLK